MPRHRKKGAPIGVRAAPAVLSGQENRKDAARLKVWLFRLSWLVLAPALLLFVLEAACRLMGFGYSTSFLLPSLVNGKKVFVQNDRFGWRFFGPNHSRNPFPFSIGQSKPADTVRVFVFGESAAYGDPQPEFGLPHMLQAMLTLRAMRFSLNSKTKSSL